MIRVPVLSSFDDNQPISWLQLNEELIPASPNYVFALGYRTLEHCDSKPGEIPKQVYEGKYELINVAIVLDKSYTKYLKQVGVV